MMPKSSSSRTMSTTRVLRMSGTFSLKVTPSTVTTGLPAIVRRMIERATRLAT